MPRWSISPHGHAREQETKPGGDSDSGHGDTVCVGRFATVSRSMRSRTFRRTGKPRGTRGHHAGPQRNGGTRACTHKIEIKMSSNGSMSAFPPKADIPQHRLDVRYVAKAEIALVHSITSSARLSTVCGIARPSVLAAFRFTTSSYFVGACTGRSAGFSPLRIRST